MKALVEVGRGTTVLALLLPFAIFPAVGHGAEKPDFNAIQSGYDSEIRPLLRKFCHDCHSPDLAEAEVDLAAFKSLADVRKHPKVWQKVREMLESGQMPPKESRQPGDADRARLQKWVREYLTAEAAARAGDPGRVVLRRLNNAEYTYTLRDLTGVASLDPAREFPVDGAAGEGFTNTGSALVMSPALVTKYLDAAKDVAAHAVLLPDGFRFSPLTSRRDWTEESLAKIREFYRQYTDAGGGTAVNLQGIQFETNQGGRLPVEKYLSVTLSRRDDLTSGRTSVEAVARESGLNPKYLNTLWQALTADNRSGPSLLIDRLRARWRTAKSEDASALAADIARWQQVLWKFNSIGHIGRHLGRLDGPQSWMEPATPLAARQDVLLKLTPGADRKDVTLYLAAGAAGDGNEHDYVVWENPRLVAPGRADLPLRDVRATVAALAAYKERITSRAAKCLTAAAATIESAPDKAAVEKLARQHGVEPEILSAWLDYLGIGGGETKIDGYIKQKQEKSENYDFIKGWVAADALSVVANSSDQHVRIPGNMKPHSVAVHPSPKLRAIVGWRSPANATLHIEGAVQHAHPECGNGVTWSLELRREKTIQRLASGIAQGATPVKFGPLENVAVRTGEVVSLVIGPRDGNHSCDLTAIDISLRSADREWSLARDVSPDILAGNPHADSFGNAGVWHFYSEPDGGVLPSIPAGSLVARWQSAATAEEKQKLADELQRLLQAGGTGLAKGSPDAALYQQLTSLNGPLLSAVRNSLVSQPRATIAADSPYGVDPALFGKHPAGGAVDSASLCVQAPATIEVRLPADLVEGCEFVTGGTLHRPAGVEGSVQLQVVTSKPDLSDLSPVLPVVVTEESAARKRFAAACDAMRQLFPAALCYSKIVPVDEVVTLTLFYREDDQLRRLMLDDKQAAQLDRLWDELFYVSQEPFLLAAAFEQIVEFATQDRPDMVKAFAPMRGPVNDRAAAFRKRLIDTESRHLESLIVFAPRAYRRPLAAGESRQLTDLYAGLRKQELSHEEAFRLTLARVLVAPAFLYRLEKPGPGAAQKPVTDGELAGRLSYFLWSSQPDEELSRVAAAGELHKTDVLLSQLRRMVRDPKTRRLAGEFAGQWLHIHGFDQHDEKSERHFPTFAGLRGAMSEESILFFTDLFQNDGSILNILDADYTFLNEDLANHYGIPGVTGPEWRRVENVKKYSRGGILTQATTLSKQSGASRTSPILRGNWLSEVVLGEKLPRPPKNVPQLGDTVPEGLTERQLIEKHSSDPACAKCHARIDPLGFALENFDAIGRFREKDAAGLSVDSRTQLPDGTKLKGLDGLRSYLLKDRREAFVRQFNRKLLGYALGRSVQLSDEPLLSEMATTLEKHEYRISAVLETIVLSRQFREIRGRDVADEE